MVSSDCQLGRVCSHLGDTLLGGQRGLTEDGTSTFEVGGPDSKEVQPQKKNVLSPESVLLMLLLPFSTYTGSSFPAS